MSSLRDRLLAIISVVFRHYSHRPDKQRWFLFENLRHDKYKSPDWKVSFVLSTVPKLEETLTNPKEKEYVEARKRAYHMVYGVRGRKIIRFCTGFWGSRRGESSGTGIRQH